MNTTNVKPNDLNYDRYATSKYDRDIVNSIPFHRELHEQIAAFMMKGAEPKKSYDIVDLGVGTGITSKLILDLLPNAHLDAVDFSRQMLDGAKKKLGAKNVSYLFGDYAKMKFRKKYDIVVAVIGIHHQTTAGKKALFKKIHALLKPGGTFIFGDLVTYRKKTAAAYNNALHYHHLVEKASDQKTLEEWAFHHQYLNDLAPIEDQIAWLKADGFKVSNPLLKMNTALLICKKSEN